MTSSGLFPIPEYPEYEAERGMWSTALEVLLTTLRYIAPATLLTLFWGQQSFLFKLLKYIDSAVRSLIFSNEEQKQTVLQWLGEAGPVRVDKLEVVWRHGWIVCGVLDAALPGACAGHPPTKLSLKHAQTIADNYLGVEPVFSRQELESNNSLSRHQEWKLINYLENIRLSIGKLTPPTPPKSTNQSTQKTTTEVEHYTLDYIARGSGLIAAQVKNKAYFKIYPTAQQSLDPGEINILIHGPKDTYGITVLPPILGKAQMIRQNLLGLQSKTSYTENILPITQGTTYLRSYGNNNINKTFYIPKTKYDIDIDIELTQEHARIGYVANLEGKYEISITTRGQNVVGSPFMVTASNNIIKSLERDSFCLEDGEEIDIVDVKTDKKVVLRIVDFVSEKMLLKENGTFEKITDEQARHLMQTDNVNDKNNEDYRVKKKKVKVKSKSNHFYYTAQKVIILNRVCKHFRNIRNGNPLFKKIDTHDIDYKQNLGIPDILNSTVYDKQSTTKNLPENRNRIIIPENISVSLFTEKPNTLIQDNTINDTLSKDKNVELDHSVNYLLKTDYFEDDTISVDTTQSSNNPFVNDTYDNSYTIEKGLGPFIPNEYETHNSQNEETENLTDKLFIDNQFNTNNNPFVNVIELERPKTPVYKIISGEVTNRSDSLYIDSEQLNSFEFNSSNRNPFLKHEPEILDLYQEKPDFIIGAPVSLPPVNFVPTNASTKTDIETVKNTEKKNKQIKPNFAELKGPADDPNFSSLDSNSTQDIIIIPRRSITPTPLSQSQSSREMSPKKDTWDSAYVSIDDNHYLLENNNSELMNETFHKRRSPLSDEFSKMGPAEREIWQCDTELKDVSYMDEDYRLYKCDLKRPEFTPIIEENERSVTSGMKDDTYASKAITDSVAEAFFELDEIYDNNHTHSEVNSTSSDNKVDNLNLEYTVETNDISVNSASEIVTDVKRHAKKLEGAISEVQVEATESVSVSQSLHVKDNENYLEQNNNNEIQFGDRIYSNIVLERKKYWDDKIKQIEARSEEIRVLQNRRKLQTKHLRRNDSISKRKGKKIVQHLLKSGQEDYDIYTKPNTQITRPPEVRECTEEVNHVKVSEKGAVESNKYNLTLNESKPAINEIPIKPINETEETTFLNNDIIEHKKQISNSILQLKQELSEKVFQAFETSPKRFFGTSRKHILHKIDTFLGSSDDDEETKHTSIISRESGLVSSRISLYHSISQTEDVPCLRRRKSKSMHNVSRQESETSYSEYQIHKETNSVIEKKDKSLNENKINIRNPDMTIDNEIQATLTPLKEKRARLMQNINNKSFDDAFTSTANNLENNSDYVKRTINVYNKRIDTLFQSSASKLKSISKSEMDIFNKSTATLKDNDLEKHKSYEELPKLSVKNFISLYEDVSKSSNTTSPVKSNNNVLKPTWSLNNHVSRVQGTTSKVNTPSTAIPSLQSSPAKSVQLENRISPLDIENISPEPVKTSTTQNTSNALDIDTSSNHDIETNYISLSDIEIEIIDKDQERQESSPETKEPETDHLDYKNRFTQAKKFFQSLEELREEKTLKNFSTNEVSPSNETIESHGNCKNRKRNNIKKSHSMPSSEIAKVWNQMQEQSEENKKLVKISEKFNVDDLFEDVMEGRLSRQGSLRGIPHKKAVLETFRSMENIADCKLNSYDISESDLSDFTADNKSRSAQTYLSEYPYLPTTDPSKYHSRLDVNASGLITFKELKTIPRRNSVPDLRLNPTFTADL